MIAAAARRGLDFENCDAPNWDLKEEWVCLRIEQEIAASTYAIGTLRDTMIGVGATDPGFKRSISDQASGKARYVGTLLMPWGESQKPTEKEVISRKSKWEERYGKLDDPRTQAIIDATVKSLEANRRKPDARRSQSSGKARSELWQ